MLSNAAYVREVPNDVLELREKFPMVDRVLSTYQHIHPALGTPELAKFFKDRTHVQSVDFDKICREVFLPKLTTNVAPPVRDELIGYTRLLQKGPVVSQMIWVLTKSGNTKPSDQVFFGKEFSPAEDWEHNSIYCPQVDFLSADYLQGVTQAEVPAWKGFFEQTGVKERADNPYVGDFAVAFVKQRMAAELGNFVSKEHQQHGYDLEARRLIDNAIVCLEVKGQKREGPVELVGNEPAAAQQAKQKNQPFWLCVVPGIPEQPQLWVIDDPLTAGEFKTVTIDSSRWKGSGRRVA